MEMNYIIKVQGCMIKYDVVWSGSEKTDIVLGQSNINILQFKWILDNWMHKMQTTYKKYNHLSNLLQVIQHDIRNDKKKIINMDVPIWLMLK